MAQQASAKSNLHSNDQPQDKAPLVRQAYDPLGLAPREFFSMAPFSLMRSMAEEMDRVFTGAALSGGTAPAVLWAPSIEVSRHNGDISIRAELPGLKPEEVKVEMIDGALVVEGERKFEKEEDQHGIYRTERRYGRFYRSIPLPEGAKADQARAKFENGILEVTVPVTERPSDRRQIPIESSSRASAEKKS
jgi:HSP20 family protein